MNPTQGLNADECNAVFQSNIIQYKLMPKLPFFLIWENWEMRIQLLGATTCIIITFSIMTHSIKTFIIMSLIATSIVNDTLSNVMSSSHFYCDTECRFAECHYVKCRYAQCHDRNSIFDKATTCFEKMKTIVRIPTFTLTWRHLVVKVLIYI